MRDEDEIQNKADQLSSILSNGKHVGSTVEHEGKTYYNVERLRGLLDGLDWALDEDAQDPI